MNVFRIAVVVLLTALFTPVSALATNTVLAGTFDGTELSTSPLPGTCDDADGPLSFDASTTFRVGTTGSYLVFDAFNLHTVDVSVLIYQGGFNPSSPQSGLVTPDGVDEADFVSLSGGTDYTLVVQQWCEDVEGAWAVSFTGPGSVTSTANRTVPAMTQGEFSGGDPTASTECSTGQFVETGPVQVSSTGTYYYSDVSIQFDVDICLQVYSAPFDPGNPNANRVDFASPEGWADDWDSIELQEGQNYYFVVQPLGGSMPGDYFYIFAPPADFRINQALDGGWYDATTPGQGMFLDTFDELNFMFLGWYTFDLARPVDGTAELGEPGHRWLTAQGTIDGATANLDVYLAEGGVFDASDPPVDSPQTKVGTLNMEFSGCTAAIANYSLTTPPVSGQMTLQPLTGSHVKYCEELVEVPGMPGPL